MAKLYILLADIIPHRGYNEIGAGTEYEIGSNKTAGQICPAAIH